MPASNARALGALKACGSTIGTAMASALAAMAAFIALTISPTSALAEPVHWEVQSSRAQASSMPYCVGTKNGLVVTWLTNTSFHFGWVGRVAALACCTPPNSANALPAPVTRSMLRRTKRPASRSWNIASSHWPTSISSRKARPE